MFYGNEVSLTIKCYFDVNIYNLLSLKIVYSYLSGNRKINVTMISGKKHRFSKYKLICVNYPLITESQFYDRKVPLFVIKL